MLCRFRFFLLPFIVLAICSGAAAQLAMPDIVNTGTSKHYNVDPGTVPGSSYIWKINGVTQPTSTMNEINITWNTPGTFLLEVQERSVFGCLGAIRSGQVIVSSAPVPTSSDLAIAKTVDKNNPVPGQSVRFIIIASNNGPDAATNVIVTEILQGGFAYISSISSSGTYLISTGVWTIGTLNSGVSETLTITAKVNSSGSYNNNASISGSDGDPDLRNNLSMVTIYPADFFIPQGFSPNGDGINDLFVIRGIDIYPENSFKVFNRWGVKVFEEAGYKNTWDGSASRGLNVGGNKLPSGTYFYLLDPGDGSAVIKGTIFLYR
jgi:gliding motility-associated-like protein/uncharacterized repeat protein (TIGR01451 family)